MSKWEHLVNRRNGMDGRNLLTDLPRDFSSCVFFDPQYRGVLDRLNYGNEGKTRGKARAALTQMTELDMSAFMLDILRVLKPSGYLFLWVDKFHLMEDLHRLVPPRLKVVDMIVWDKGRMGMGYRSRRQAEYCVVAQLPPIRAKGTWELHTIPDVWTEPIRDRRHVHQKPYGLITQLIKATAQEGPVVDPAAGSFVVLDVCEDLGVPFYGTDVEEKP